MQQKHKVRKHIFFTIYFISDTMWLHYYRCISKILIDTSDCMLKSVFDDHVYTTALLVITIVLLLNWFLQLPSKVPPGPMILPLIGCLDRFDENNIQKVYQKWRKKYGDVFSFRLGSKLYVVVNGYENIKEYVLDHNQVFSNRATNYLFTTLLKNAGKNICKYKQIPKIILCQQ